MNDNPQNETAPTWSDIDEQLLCPLCDYNLRGLIEPLDEQLGAIMVLEGEQGTTQLFTPASSVRWDFRTLDTALLCGQATR